MHGVTKNRMGNGHALSILQWFRSDSSFKHASFALAWDHPHQHWWRQFQWSMNSRLRSRYLGTRLWLTHQSPDISFQLVIIKAWSSISHIPGSWVFRLTTQLAFKLQAGLVSRIWFCPLVQVGLAKSSVSISPRSGDLSAPGHLRYLADSEPHGAVSDGVQGGVVVDEGRVSGAGSRPLQADGEVQEGRRFPEGCQRGCLLEGAELIWMPPVKKKYLKGTKDAINHHWCLVMWQYQLMWSVIL